MKTKNVILSSVVLFALMLISAAAFSQDKKEATIKIKTSAVCDQCKERIEKSLAFEKGVKTAVLDVDTKILTVTYNPSKTTPDDIRKAVSKLGYDADNIAKDKAAYAKLPSCCKKETGK